MNNLIKSLKKLSHLNIYEKLYCKDLKTRINCLDFNFIKINTLNYKVDQSKSIIKENLNLLHLNSFKPKKYYEDNNKNAAFKENINTNNPNINSNQNQDYFHDSDIIINENIKKINLFLDIPNNNPISLNYLKEKIKIKNYKAKQSKKPSLKTSNLKNKDLINHKRNRNIKIIKLNKNNYLEEIKNLSSDNFNCILLQKNTINSSTNNITRSNSNNNLNNTTNSSSSTNRNNNNNIFKFKNSSSFNYNLSKNLFSTLTTLNKEDNEDEELIINDEDVKKNIDIGGDFADALDHYYFDKTLGIKEVFESGYKVYLITMPRRFGKSLFLDMLRRFVDICEYSEAEKDENKNIFNNKVKYTFENNKYKYAKLNISNQEIKYKNRSKSVVDKATNIQGTYPAISVKFDKITVSESAKNVKQSVASYFEEIIIKFSYIRNNEKLKGLYDKLLIANETRCEETLSKLSYLLHEYHGKKVWIFIDECEIILKRAILDLPEAETSKVFTLFQNILSLSLKSNEYLYKGVLVGIIKMTSDFYGSSFNNYRHISITNNKFSKYFGISKEELEEYYKFRQNVDHITKDKIKSYYNGYKFLNYIKNNKLNYDEKYNIWSLANYFSEYDENNCLTKIPIGWWANELNQVYKMPFYYNSVVRNYLIMLYLGYEITFTLKSEFSLLDLKNVNKFIDIVLYNNNKKLSSKNNDIKINSNLTKIENLEKEANLNNLIGIGNFNLYFSYLFHTGYLSESRRDLNNIEIVYYKIPNMEIMTKFRDSLIAEVDSMFDFYKLNDLKNAITDLFEDFNPELNAEFKIKTFAEVFEKSFNSKTYSFFDVKSNSKEKKNNFKFTNEALIKAIICSIGYFIKNIKLSSERIFFIGQNKDSNNIHAEIIEIQEILNNKKKKNESSNGKPDVVLEKNGVGIIIETKYNHYSKSDSKSRETDAKKALIQAKSYEVAVKDDEYKVYIGFNVYNLNNIYMEVEIFDSNNQSLKAFNYITDQNDEKEVKSNKEKK